MPHHPPRRTVLSAGAAGATALLIAGCTGGGKDEPPPGPPPSPEEEVRERAARQSSALLARYDATLEAHPDLSDQLTPLRTAVAAHLTEFSGRRTPARKPDPQASQAGGTSEVPTDRAAALTSLADAERRTTDARTRALKTAPPETARLLASVAASGAVHGYLLTELLSEVG